MTTHTDEAEPDMSTTTKSSAASSDASTTPTCSVCEEPVVLTEPHYTLCLHIEVEDNGTVDVLHGEVLAYHHQHCYVIPEYI